MRKKNRRKTNTMKMENLMTKRKRMKAKMMMINLMTKRMIKILKMKMMRMTNLLKNIQISGSITAKTSSLV